MGRRDPAATKGDVEKGQAGFDGPLLMHAAAGVIDEERREVTTRSGVPDDDVGSGSSPSRDGGIQRLVSRLSGILVRGGPSTVIGASSRLGSGQHLVSNNDGLLVSYIYLDLKKVFQIFINDLGAIRGRNCTYFTRRYTSGPSLSHFILEFR